MAQAPPSTRLFKGRLLRFVGLASFALTLAVTAGSAWAWHKVSDSNWLSRFATQRINAQIAGEATGTFAYRPPLGLTVCDLRIARAPGEPAVLVVQRAHLHVSLRSLLRGHINIAGPWIDGVSVDAATPGKTDKNQTALNEALALRAPSETSRQGIAWYERIPVTLQSVRITHLRAAWQQDHDFRQAQDGSLELFAQGSLARGRASFRAQLEETMVSSRELAWERTATATTFRVPRLEGVAERAHVVVVSANGALREDDQASFHATLEAALHAQTPTWRQWFPKLGSRQLDGDVALSGTLRFDGDVHALEQSQATLDLVASGHHLRVAQRSVDAVSVHASMHEGHIVLKEASVWPSPTQAIRAGGTMQLQHAPHRPLAIRDHELLLEVANLSPRTAWPSLPMRGGAVDGVFRVQGTQCSPAQCDSQIEGVASARAWPKLPRAARPLTFALRAQAHGTETRVSDLRFRFGSAGEIRGRARADWAHDAAPLTAHLHAALHAFDPIAQALNWPITAKHAALTLEVTGNRRAPRAKALLSADDLTLTEAPHVGALGTLRVPIDATKHALCIRDAKLVGPSGAARLEAQVPWAPSAPLSGGLRLEGVPVPLLEGSIGYVSGSAAWMGNVNHPSLVTFFRLVSADGLRGHALDAAAIADASPRDITLTGLAARIGMDGHLFAHGHWLGQALSLDAQARHVPLLEQKRQSQALADSGVPLDAEVHVDSTDAQTMSGALRLRALTGWLDAELQGQRGARRSLRGYVQGQWPVAPFAFLSPALQSVRPGGELKTQLTFAVRNDHPTLSGNMTWHKPHLFGDALAAGDVTLDASTPKPKHIQLAVRAADARALHSDLAIDVSRARAPRVHLTMHSLSVAALLPPLRSHGAELWLKGSIDTRVTGANGAEGMARIDALRLHMAHQDLTLEDPLSLAFRKSGFTLDDTFLSGSAGRLHVKGRLGERIDAALSGRLQVDLLALLLAPIRHARGEVAFDLEAHGANGHPQIDAQMSVVKPVALEAEGLASQLQIAQGRARFFDDTLVIDRVDGLLEGGSFRLQGRVAAPKLRPQQFQVQLTGLRLPVRAGPLLAESNIALEAKGDLQKRHALVRGDVDITEGRVLRRFDLRDLKFRSREKKSDVPLERRMPWLHDIALDVHAKNRGGFDVRVDAGSFALASALECDVHIGGTAMMPKLNGKVHATDGNVQFPRGRLVLRQASIEFDPARISRTNALGTDINVYAQGEVTPSTSQASQAYDVSLRLDGHPHALSLDLSSSQGLTKMDILSLLTTGHANLGDLAQGGDDGAKLDAALSVAGSQVTGPVARMAEKLLERRLNVQIELGSEVSEGNVRFTAAKNLHRRLRLETAYSHGLTAEQSAVSTRAQLSFTDRLLLEGRAARDLTGSSSSVGNDHAVQSNLELKLRLLGH